MKNRFNSFYYSSFFPRAKSLIHLNRYIDFILSRKDRVLKDSDYTEIHHIVPRFCLFKKVDDLDKNNLIILTAREHFIAHMILWKAFGDKMTYAFFMMRMTNPSNQKRYFNLSSRQYQKLKADFSKKVSEQMKGHSFRDGRKYINNGIICKCVYEVELPNYFDQGFVLGRLPFSEETKRKMSESSKQRKHSEETKLKISISGKGRKDSLETKRRKSIANKKTNSDRVGITKNKLNLRVKQKDLESYLSQNWRIGVYREERHWMNNGKVSKIVYKNEVNKFLQTGWNYGRII